MAENDNCILDTLHTQFAENQNHHQSLFVQFLVALLALFAGFGFVYTHTKPDIPYNQTYVEISENLICFSNIILLSTAVIVSCVLALLNLILLNQGYGFRRDQYLNMIIRKDKLQKNMMIFLKVYTIQTIKVFLISYRIFTQSFFGL